MPRGCEYVVVEIPPLVVLVISDTSNSTIGEESSSVLVSLTLASCILAIMRSLLENDCVALSTMDEFRIVAPSSSFTMTFIVTL